MYVKCKLWRKHSKTKTIWRKKVQYYCLKIISRFLHDFKDNVSNFAKEFKVDIEELFFHLNFTWNQFGKSILNIKICYKHSVEKSSKTWSLFLRKSQHFFRQINVLLKKQWKSWFHVNFCAWYRFMVITMCVFVFRPLLSGPLVGRWQFWRFRQHYWYS